MATSSLIETQRALAPVLTVGPAREDSVQTVLWYGDRKGRRDSVAREYEAVAAHGAGLIDCSWLAKLRITGPERLTFLQGMISQDVASLKPGDSRHAAMLDPSGHFVAELYVHALDDMVLIETDTRAMLKFHQTLTRYLIMEDAELEDVSADWAVISLQGSHAAETTASLLNIPVLPNLVNTPIKYGGSAGFAVGRSHSRYGGVDIWLPVDAAAEFWRASSAEIGVVGELAVEILRIEAGIPRWGTELDSSVLLLEADLDDAVSFGKGCYIGQEIVARIHARGHTNRSLRAFLFEPGAPVDPGNKLFPENGMAEREVGRVTSVVDSPLTGGCLGFGYVRREYTEDGTELMSIASTGAPCPGVVRTFPL